MESNVHTLGGGIHTSTVNFFSRKIVKPGKGQDPVTRVHANNVHRLFSTQQDLGYYLTRYTLHGSMYNFMCMLPLHAAVRTRLARFQ